MGIERVRKQIIKGAEKKSQELGAEMELDKVIASSFKMAEGFFKRGNFTGAFFMYFKCLKSIALLSIRKKIGDSSISDDEAINIVIEKGLLPLKKSQFDTFLERFKKVLSRKKLEKNECLDIMALVRRLMRT